MSELDNEMEILICSNCFRDEGLKLDAFTLGIDNEMECPNCKSRIGKKLTKELVLDLCYIFFVRGTIYKRDYGGYPRIQFNNQHYKNSDVTLTKYLKSDFNIIEEVGKIGLFHYGPRFWMFGEIEPLKSLQERDERESIVEKIIELYPSVKLSIDQCFYRLRKNPEIPHDNFEYDSAPNKFLGKGRFDFDKFPILYGSPDLELCLHECRTTVEDDLYVAKLMPQEDLKLLDLTALLKEEGVTEFESIDLAVHFLFLAESHSYDICRAIAKRAKENGFDGIIYPSYFSYIRTGHMPFETIYGIAIRRMPYLADYVEGQSIPSLALFGYPIKEGKVKVDCINRVVLNNVKYSYSFGPAQY
ncbi:MAG: RES family NAD+ phosphorylase [Fusobacteriaceae bacterium]|nr:RES family NAD+ phosphorylase [Fusobacteriaceae bacterium]MBN2837456.1 RES family NAD+ phosphorylase [Fusobacteriaceae bacterium]